MQGQTLVLKKFKLNPTGQGGEPVIEMIGRPSGVIAFVLTLMGLDTMTTLRVTDLSVSLKRASLSGEIMDFVPLPHLSSTHCGFSKPISLLFTAAAIALFATIAGLNERNGGGIIVVGLLIGVAFVVGYVLSKKIHVVLRADSGYPLEVKFKPSVIEGVPVDINFTMQALALLNEKVLQAA